jgi:hypothetical protein
MHTMFTKFAVALALAGAFALGTATVAVTGASEAKACIQHYDGSGAPVGPYC